MQTMPNKYSHIKYLAIIIVTPLVLGFLVFMTNYLVDPLWYFNGNVITKQNYMWNERLAKANLLFKNPAKYNCLILGSSRSILLDPNKIEGYSCFNYSFVLGSISHYVQFLSYFSTVSGPPELVIIGIDSPDLLPENQGHLQGTVPPVPDFVRSADRPPSVIATYLSYKALDFSFRTLLGLSPNRIYYRQDFTGDILPESGPFDPGRLFEPDLKSGMFPLAGFTQESVERFRYLLEMLPQNTRVVAYTPPISAHYVARLALEGTLNAYLQTMYGVGQLFDEFYDFTAPSDWTKRAELTYDGGHFYRRVIDEMATVLNGAPVEAALDVHQMSWPQYRDRFRSSVEEYILERGLQL